MTEMLLLALGACLAGAMNAVAGGGTIITFPLLIAFGMPAIQANATSTFALLAGIVGSLYGFRRELPATRRVLGFLAPVSIAGGLAGAWLLTRTSEAFFEELVPFLILFASVLFLLSRVVSRWAGIENGPTNHPAHLVLAVIAQGAVAVYGGYFGAGIGILMLAALGLMGHSDIHHMNAIKTVLSALINVVATVYFIVAGLIVWPQAVVMTIGATVGYYAGAAFSTRIPQPVVRGLVVVVGLTLSAIFFWRRLAG
jgi:uncharacterized protein